MNDYEVIQEELKPFNTGSRTESAALLAWFLAVVWRIEPEDIDDAICDGQGDKGIDGILVDDDLGELTLLQAKHKVQSDGHQGDKDLRDLVGAAEYFASEGSIQGLLAANPNAELRRLLTRLDVQAKVAAGAHATRLVFVTDGTLDDQGHGYVDIVARGDPPLEVWDQPRLATIARRTRKPDLISGTVTLTAVSTPAVVRTASGRDQLAIGVVPAVQLMQLPGIDDLSLFARNVRLSEGRTRINRELGDTIDDPAEHELFPAYHNGLTMLTHGLTVSGDTMTLEDVTVVNGCQSLLTLHQHKTSLTDKLHLLVKVVQVERTGSISDKITYRSNNQNPVDIRDQRSTDVVQRDLQGEVRNRYGSAIFFAIREGEDASGVRVLDNKTAAQFLMAVYLKEPWNAVRKVRLFDTDYRRIFNHTITGDKLYLMDLMIRVVDSHRKVLRDELTASFASVRFALAFLLAQLLRQSERGTLLLETPERWLPDKEQEVIEALHPLMVDVVKSVNFYVEEERKERAAAGEDFDPKVAFKSRASVQDLENQVLRLSERLAMQVQSYWFEVTPAR